ncbi:hypothetical protein K1W54_33145 [Micromonospora sp. CPCC 205371]|nr:hypothetical protein [Micromonospora sp. CPCC 205371]
MIGKLRKTAIVALAAVPLAFALVGGSAAQAAAISDCTAWQPKTIDLPGINGEHGVSMKVCVERNGNYLRGAIHWKETFRMTAYSDRYDGFEIDVRLERYDNHIAWRTCDVKSAMNNGVGSSGTCYTSWVETTLKNGWTGDGQVWYDVNNDGKGGFYWYLHGSPQLP